MLSLNFGFCLKMWLLLCSSGKDKEGVATLGSGNREETVGTEPCKTVYIRNECYFFLKSSSTPCESWAVEWKVTFLELTFLSSLFFRRVGWAGMGRGKNLKEKGLSECTHLWLECKSKSIHVHWRQRVWHTSLQVHSLSVHWAPVWNYNPVYLKWIKEIKWLLSYWLL